MFVVVVDSPARALEGMDQRLAELRTDWEVEWLPDAQTALAIADSRPADVVIADLHSGGMDGAALLREFQSRRPETVRVLLAQHENEEEALRTMSIAHRVLAKPCSAEELADAVDRVRSLHGILSSERIRELVGRVDRLPPAPRLYLRLTQALEDPDSDAGQIAKLVGQDPALAAKVLQLCNSALFSPGRSVNDIRSAVTRLGLRALRTIALAAEVFARPGAGAADAEALQRRSLLASTLAARLLPHRAAADLAGTAALLADVGLLLPGLGNDHAKLGTADAQAESELPPHAGAGAYLLGLWGLPMPIVEAVAFHHQPGRGGSRTFGIVGAVHVAVGLAQGHPLDERFLAATGMLDRLPQWQSLFEGFSEAA
jgi:HD-like signal output (HDOD) protein/ActR/RegA family two-component response regulator